ncbi:MAG: hypothetical protein ACD_41C00304G0003 [uncultured bacterium]|nr:MAG: hypothetical protein ACD_41C00304G0003 [uncultured bacterium]
MQPYDVVIVGGGPAGLTAALYTARRKLRTLVISKDLGGQAATTTVIENYPGVGAIDGFALMQRFKDQAVSYGAEFVLGDVQTLKPLPGGLFSVGYSVTTQVQARSVILAFGLTPRSLGVPGEVDLVGKGVTYSTALLADALHNKTVAVVGGGNSAIESVNLLADIAKQVYLIHRRDRFRAETILLDKMEQQANVTKVLNAELKQVHGTKWITGITVAQGPNQPTQRLAVDALCINVGFMSRTSWLDGVVAMNEKHEVMVQADCTTSMAGIFAAGDITTSNYKQVVVSAGEGCKAALACYTYLGKKDGKDVSIDQDWEVTSGHHFIRS